MLTKEQIEANKDRFLRLISEIDIPGADVGGLVDYLDTKTDFFTAPASTQYHCNYEGGLCYHSLNVYDNLIKLCDLYKDKLPKQYEKSSLLVVALLHDLSKVNFYEKYVQNKKFYSDRGTKSDTHGNFDWIAEEAYKTKDASERFLAGNHGFNSVMLISRYIPMNIEETAAVYNHMAGSDDKNIPYDLSAIFNAYPIAILLHLADMAATFVDERN